MNKSIGIIGFGRFGQLIARYLKKDFPVYIFDKIERSEINKIIGVEYLPLEELCKKDIILLAMPISALEQVLNNIKDKIKKASIIIDICSVKEIPCNLMEKYLPETVEILGTHPLFGPDSASRSLKDRKIVLCPVRIKDKNLECIEKYLCKQGLSIIHMTPREHDREISISLNLTHFIGRAMIDMGLCHQEIETLGYQRLLKILSTVQNDTWQLFEDMNKYNRYAKEVREKFINSLNKIDGKLEKS